MNMQAVCASIEAKHRFLIRNFHERRSTPHREACSTTQAKWPTQLPETIAQGLLEVTAKDGMLIELTNYPTGDRVALIGGPFAGWLAQVISADDTGRIRLLVDIMGRTTPIKIAGGDLERRG